MKTLLAVARAAGKAGDILWASRRRDVLRTPQADGLVGASPHLARVLVAAAGPVLASARPACAALPPDRGAACTAAVDALAAVVATMAPLLDPCPGDPAEEERQACEVERVGKVRDTLPELRQRVTAAAAVVR